MVERSATMIAEAPDVAVARSLGDSRYASEGFETDGLRNGTVERIAITDLVLRSAPIGFDLGGASDGAISNEAATSASAPEVRALHTAVPVDGPTYAVSTTVDLGRQKKLEAELFRRAHFDDLTGLPNRSYLQHAVAELVDRDQSRFALAFVDIDDFKHINDYYGHAVGDQILTKLAARVSDVLPAGDLLARIGGDEFVLLLQSDGGAGAVLKQVGRLLARLKQPFFAEGYEIFTSASIGISLYPEHGDDYDTLRRHADLAMYSIKGRQKGAVALFDDDMRAAADARMETEQRLRLAIRDRRFLCAYQPKVDIHTRATVGLEVLLRWRDEAGFIHPPGDFIGLAVELGMINDISRLVLNETMAALDDIDAVFGSGTTISFNVAAKQAGDCLFMETFVADLAATGCAERFMLELTEEAFFAKSELQATILPMLRRIGTKVSIDDFGVGYSSLSALADLTADELKIDRSFITDIHRRPRSQSILKAIESLGHALGMNIIAEGLETIEELTYLSEATQIRNAQGFFFSKPLSLDQMVSRKTMHPMSRSRPALRDSLPSRSIRGRFA